MKLSIVLVTGIFIAAMFSGCMCETALDSTARTPASYEHQSPASGQATSSTLLANQPPVGGQEPASPLWMRQPVVRLQARAGAGGGNPVSIDMKGTHSIYVNTTSTSPLSMTLPVSMNDKAVVYVQGGMIPPGQLFRVKRVSFFGSAAGDTNGHGEVIITVGQTSIVNMNNVGAGTRDEWRGQIDIASGQEGSVKLQIANSSCADVLIEGEFVDAPKH